MQFGLSVVSNCKSKPKMIGPVLIQEGPTELALKEFDKKKKKRENEKLAGNIFMHPTSVNANAPNPVATANPRVTDKASVPSCIHLSTSSMMMK